MEDVDLSEKQGYLRLNILEKGFDADEFMKFLEYKKGEDGLDLNNWNMEELKLSVREFVKSKGGEVEELINAPTNEVNNNDTNNINNINEISANEPKEISEQVKEDRQEVSKIPDQNSALNKLDDYFVPCKKTEITVISTKKEGDVIVRLAFPEKVDGGFLAKSYVSYLVQTEPFGFKVRKRYSDFDWLRNYLCSHYINCVIPPLCKKNYGNRFDEHLISKRTRSIEKFFQSLLIHPVIKHSKILYDFLSSDKEADFIKIKNLYNKEQYPTCIGDIKSDNGFINVSVNQKKETYFENIKDNAMINEDIMSKITKSYKELMNIFKSASEKLKEISDLWKGLYMKSTKYFESSYTSETYNILSKLMDDWASIQTRQSFLVNSDIREYIRFVKNEFSGVTQLAERVDNNKVVFSKAFEKLKATKENLFKAKDLTQWDLTKEDLDNKLSLLQNPTLAYTKMLPKETKKVNDLKNFYGMYLNSIISEYERLRFLNGKRHKENVINFCKQFSQLLTDFHVSVADHLAYFDDIKEISEEQE